MGRYKVNQETGEEILQIDYSLTDKGELALIRRYLNDVGIGSHNLKNELSDYPDSYSQMKLVFGSKDEDGRSQFKNRESLSIVGDDTNSKKFFYAVMRDMHRRTFDGINKLGVFSEEFSFFCQDIPDSYREVMRRYSGKSYVGFCNVPANKPRLSTYPITPERLSSFVGLLGLLKTKGIGVVIQLSGYVGHENLVDLYGVEGSNLLVSSNLISVEESDTK